MNHIADSRHRPSTTQVVIKTSSNYRTAVDPFQVGAAKSAGFDSTACSSFRVLAKFGVRFFFNSVLFSADALAVVTLTRSAAATCWRGHLQHQSPGRIDSTFLIQRACRCGSAFSANWFAYRRHWRTASARYATQSLQTRVLRAYEALLIRNPGWMA